MAGVKGMGNPEDVQPKPFAPQAVQAPQMATAAPTTQEIDYDALVAQASPAPSSNEIDYDALVANATQSEDVAPSFMEQVKQFPARFEASFANTPERKQFVLERRYGKDNVRKNEDNSFDIKKDKKWIKFDSDQFEILNDVVADWGRDVIEQGSTELATAGGIAVATAGSAASGGAAVPVAGSIIAGSRLAGGAAGNAIAQVIAHDVYGIPRGTIGEQATDVAVAAGANALFGKIGDYIGSYFAKKGADKATRMMGQTVDESLQTDIKVLKEASEELENAGIIKPVTNQFGTKTTYLPEQAVKGGDQNILMDAKKYAENPEVINVKGKLMLGLQQVIDKINNKVASVSPIKGTKVLEYANDIEMAEGAIIGKFKKEALEQGAKTRVNADIARDKIKSSMEELGYTFADTLEKTPRSYTLNRPAQFKQVKDIQRPTIESLEARGFTPEAANKLMNRLEQNYKEVLGYTYDGKTKITFEKLSALNNNIKELVNDLYKSSDVNTKARQVLTEVKDAFGGDYQKAVGAILGDTPAGKEFAAAMEKFGSIKNAKKDLTRILIDAESGQPTITAEALGRNLFGNTKSTLKEINAMKTLLKDDPGVWDQIRRVHLDDLKKKNFKNEKYDVLGYANDILKLPSEVGAELMGGKENLKLVGNIATYANRLQNYTVEQLSKDPAARKLVKNSFQLMTNFVGNKITIAYDFFASVGRDQALVKYLSDEGRDQILALTKVDGRPAMNKFIDGVIEAGVFSENRAIKASRMLTNGVLVPAAKIETRNAAQDAVSR